jgi:oligoribonuclease NrnB/cAMP/cGMP phosphodiesterase (DHH superfamily)
MKIACVFHSIDLDGWMSAAIVKHWFDSTKKPYLYNYSLKHPSLYFETNTIAFVGYNHGEPVPDLSDYDMVVMCDISFHKDVMSKLYSKLGVNFIWIDHHISAIKDNNGFIDSTFKKPEYHELKKSVIYGRRDVNFAACELTWKYFFPNEAMPEIVRLLGRYDCFGSKGTDEEQKVIQTKVWKHIRYFIKMENG